MADAALLDVAQDYALRFLHDQGLFDLGIALKGGTALRKLRAGNAGRFSTDLDFAAPDAEAGELLLDTIDGAVENCETSTTSNSSVAARSTSHW